MEFQVTRLKVKVIMCYKQTIISSAIAMNVFNINTSYFMAHSPVMCEIAISNSRKINLIIAYCFIFVLREEHLENAFA